MTLPAYSLWIGNVWESMICVVKSCIRKALSRANISYFPLLTLLSDIQISINSRPLTYISSGNSFDVITPNNFLHRIVLSDVIVRHEKSKFKSLEPPTNDILIQSLYERNKIIINSLSNTLARFILLSLRENHKYNYQANFDNKINVEGWCCSGQKFYKIQTILDARSCDSNF